MICCGGQPRLTKQETSAGERGRGGEGERGRGGEGERGRGERGEGERGRGENKETTNKIEKYDM